MENNNSVMKKAFSREIRLDMLAKVIWRNKKKYILPLTIAFVCSAFYAFSLPRYYSTKILLAPEYTSGSSLSNSSLGGLASMAGLNLGSMSSEDAIQPEFYPDLMQSTDFLVSLFDVKVKTQDGKFSGTMREYITKWQKSPWWSMGIGYVMNLFAKPSSSPLNDKANPFLLTRQEYDIIMFLRGCISCSIDKKTGIVSIATTLQDPLVTATFAEQVKTKLQDFITDYRTRKSRNDLKHFEKLLKEARAAYLAKQRAYASYSDANTDLVLQSYKSKTEYLENEMQLAYNVYSQMSQQVQIANAKVQERTPAFTTLQNATVPFMPAGPKRMITVAFFVFAVFIAYSIYFFIKTPFEAEDVILESKNKKE